MRPDDADIRELARTGRMVEAIRLYRERHGGGLKEAKDAVERLRDTDAPVGSASPGEIDPALQAEIDALLRSGKRIPAIKFLRERSSTMGLKEAKDQIDRRAQELGLPESGSGCFIATAAWGDPDAAEVMALRRYRDRVLCRSRLGRWFIRLYERLSPPLAACLRRSDTARAGVRRLLALAVRTTLRAGPPRQRRHPGE